VSFVDGIGQLSRLRQECADLAIRPATDNQLSILQELDSVAEGVGLRQFNAKELTLGLSAPHPNVAS
jgi:hypothetical protein